MTEKCVPCILGIDPGTTAGFAVGTIESKNRLIISGVHKSNEDSTVRLLEKIISDLDRYKYRIMKCIIEQQYVDEKNRKNSRTVLRIAQQAGKWEEACIFHGISFEWVMASHWQAKMLKGLVNTFSGKSDARKKASQCLSKMKWGVCLKSDASDAAIIMAYQVMKECVSRRQEEIFERYTKGL